MADGAYYQAANRFGFAQPNTTSSHNHRNTQQRKNSPSSSSRRAFQNGTVSPSQSPARRPPTGPSINMYGQNQQQGSVYLNGTHATQRYNLQMGKPFQHNQSNPSQNLHRQQAQQQQGGQQDHNGFTSHQHNTSGSNFVGASSHLSSTQMRNGTPNQPHMTNTRPQSEHWANQLVLYDKAKEQTGTHPHARNHPASKALGTTTLDQMRREADREEQNRAFRDADQDQNNWTELDLGGQGLPAISLDLFNYRFLKKLYLNNNRLTHIPVTIGKLRNLTSLDLSFNHIREIPPEIGMLINLKSLLLFGNQIEFLPCEVGFLWQLDFLGVLGNPLNETQMSILEQRGVKALIAELQEATDPPTPLDRDWLVIGDGGQKPARPEDTFKVMSYNSLCDRAASKTLYGYTPAVYLAWDHRKKIILDECRARNPDILCLQEVEHDAYNEYFRPELAQDGYKGYIQTKTRARTMTDKEAKLVDGCATLWKNSKYIQLDKQTIEFANIAINRPDMKTESDIFNRVMPRDNIALVIFLEDRVTGARLLVVNAHLHWDKAFKDVKVVQSAILLEQVNRLAEGYANWPPMKLSDKKLYRFSSGGRGGDNIQEGADASVSEPVMEPGPSQSYKDAKSIPLILCIDANSTPDSGVFELFSRGKLAPDHPDLGDYRYGKFTSEGMKHDFSLESAYTTKQLPFTNYTAAFTGMIDYIFYNASTFQVTGLLGEIDKNYLLRVPGFPNVHYPSDHLAIEAEFVIKQRKGERRAANNAS